MGEMMGGPATRPPLQIVDLSQVRIQASIGETDAVSLSTTIKLAPLRFLGITKDTRSLSRINQAVDPIVKTVLVIPHSTTASMPSSTISLLRCT